jgi:uncharacterized protein (TIGR03437 family)
MGAASLRFGLSILLLLAASLPGLGAGISVANLTAAPGQSAVTSLSFSSESLDISAIQFDIEWDSPLALKFVAGGALRSSSKTLKTALISPGVMRFLIAGTNQNILDDGELLKIFVAVDSGASPGDAGIRLTRVAAAAPNGDSATVKSQAGTVQIRSGTGGGLLAAQGVLNAASLLPGPVSPGEIVTLLGAIPRSQAVVLFNGIPAPILYADPYQVNAVVPFGLDLSGPATLELRDQDTTVTKVSVPVSATAPAIFTTDATGIGAGAILNPDYSPNSMTNPTSAGSAVMVFGTGFGVLTPPAADGQIATGIALTQSPVQATVGGIPAEVMYAGAAPGLIDGVVQINVRLPASLAPTDSAPVTLKMGSAETQAGVTVAVK